MWNGIQASYSKTRLFNLNDLSKVKKITVGYDAGFTFEYTKCNKGFIQVCSENSHEETTMSLDDVLKQLNGDLTGGAGITLKFTDGKQTYLSPSVGKMLDMFDNITLNSVNGEIDSLGLYAVKKMTIVCKGKKLVLIQARRPEGGYCFKSGSRVVSFESVCDLLKNSIPKGHVSSLEIEDLYGEKYSLS